MKKALVTILGALCLLFALSSCEGESSIDSAYGCGLHTWHSDNASDLSKVENYIKSQNCPWGTVIIRAGKSEAANDKTMKAQFDEAASKLDFSTLGLHSSTTFVYSAEGTVSDPDDTPRTVASIKWPK